MQIKTLQYNRIHITDSLKEHLHKVKRSRVRKLISKLRGIDIKSLIIMHEIANLRERNFESRTELKWYTY